MKGFETEFMSCISVSNAAKGLSCEKSVNLVFLSLLMPENRKHRGISLDFPHGIC